MPSFVFLITTLPVPILTLFPIVNPCNTVHLTPKKLALPTFVSPDIRTSGCITLQSPIVTSCPNETQPFIRLKFPIVTPQLTLPPNVITFPCPIRIDSSSKKRTLGAIYFPNIIAPNVNIRCYNVRKIDTRIMNPACDVLQYSRRSNSHYNSKW